MSGTDQPAGTTYHHGFAVNGTGTFTIFAVINGHGYAAKAHLLTQTELTLWVAARVSKLGWYWPDPELRFPAKAVDQLLPGTWEYGDQVAELGGRIEALRRR